MEKYTSSRPLRVCTLFSGYDSQCMALDRLGIPYDLVAWCEIDKYAIQAHDALYPQYSERNLGDVSKVDWDAVPDFDFMTFSSPCQDFSQAGLQRGGQEGSGTRSSLLWECKKAIIAKRPKYLFFENVKALVSNKFIKTFQEWLRELESYGYTNYSAVLNAKDYGIPQNRERIFVISILEDHTPYQFPAQMQLELKLKDMLEENVEEKYYLSEKSIEGFIAHNENHESKGTGFK